MSEPATTVTLPAIRLMCGYQVQHGDPIMGPCPECRHLLALHVGEDDCPVCRLVRAPAMQADAIREALRRSVHVLREGETLVVLLPPYFTPAQVQEYHRRVSLMMDLYDMKNQFMVLVGDGLVVAERYNLLEQFVTSDEIRDDESGQLIGYKEKEREQDQESGPEGQPDQGGGPLVAGPPAEEAGPEAPGEVPGGELPEVPDAEPEPVGDGEGRGTEGSDPDQSEDVAAAAAGGEEAKSEEADGGTVPDRSSRRAKRS